MIVRLYSKEIELLKTILRFIDEMEQQQFVTKGTSYVELDGVRSAWVIFPKNAADIFEGLNQIITDHYTATRINDSEHVVYHIIA